MSSRSVAGLSTMATAWLLVVCSLVVWSLAPMVVGWKPSVIMTGSMMPLIKPGDVLLIDPTATPKRGQIVLVTDPEAPTGRIAHRIISITKDGILTTKGDANQSADSVHHHLSDVVGVARLVVPNAGRLALMRSRPSPGDQLWALLTVLAAITLVLTHRGGAAASERRH